MLTNIGLAIIMLAWIYQAVRVVRSGTAIYAIFLVMYFVGSMFVAVGELGAGAVPAACLVAISGLLALIALFSLHRHP